MAERRAEVSLGMAVATSVLVISVYQHYTPSYVDHRVGQPGDVDASKAEKSARWTAAGIVAGISLLANDSIVLILGGATMIVLSVAHRYANMVNPLTGKATAVTLGGMGSAPDSVADLPPDMAYQP